MSSSSIGHDGRGGEKPVIRRGAWSVSPPADIDPGSLDPSASSSSREGVERREGRFADIALARYARYKILTDQQIRHLQAEVVRLEQTIAELKLDIRDRDLSIEQLRVENEGLRGLYERARGVVADQDEVNRRQSERIDHLQDLVAQVNSPDDSQNVVDGARFDEPAADGDHGDRPPSYRQAVASGARPRPSSRRVTPQEDAVNHRNRRSSVCNVM